MKQQDMRTIYEYNAVLFDLDGVLTPTSVLHRQAWKQLFDEKLPVDVPKYTAQDYLEYVDGKPRYEGVDSMLKSRGLSLPWGSPDDDVDAQTVCGYGNRKNDVFERLMHEEGIAPYPDCVDVLRHLRANHVKMAVVSSSRNAKEVLKSARIFNFFDRIVDGRVAESAHLRGKPQPDTYLYAAERLDEQPKDCVVVEDALSGVTSGRAGKFGLVVGVNRGAGEHELLAAGADVVVEQLADMIDSSASELKRRESTGGGQDPLDMERYPIDPWSFSENGRPNAQSATMFSVTNGSIGVRGSGQTSRDLGLGTFLSGFHETFFIRHAEEAYGYARIGQVIQSVPDCCDFHFVVDGKELTECSSFKQGLDFKTGVSWTEQRFAVGQGLSLEVRIERVACLFRKDLVLCRLGLTVHGGDLRIQVEAAANENKPKLTATDDPRKGEHVSSGGLETIELKEATDNDIQSGYTRKAFRCRNSRMTMALVYAQSRGEEKLPESVFFMLHDGETQSLMRYASYNTYPVVPRAMNRGLVSARPSEQDASILLERCESTLRWAMTTGEERLFSMQQDWLSEFWRQSDVTIEAENADRIQQLVHWELFNLAQSTDFVDNGIGAKGLSGSGYSGHYFWDTEIFILPFLTYNRPEAARSALHFRYTMLPAARRRADALGLEGALFPWRTINGREASAFFEAGSAQYHIDADISYAVAQYVNITHDTVFLREEGIDILVETARMWNSIGNVSLDGRFHINCVTGPDEYSALVNDDYYTNSMARFNMRAACIALDWLSDNDHEGYASACDRLEITADEHESWLKNSDSMELLHDDDLGVDMQYADFTQRMSWDFKHRNKRPLLMHYHPLDIYRHNVIKQSDLVLALYLLSDEFDASSKKADFEYYDPLTIGDSTLSASAQAIIASEIGRSDLAMRYFREALFTDVANLHGNTSDGIHLACAGGVWAILVAGFGGFRDSGGRHLSIDPKLPEEWKSLSYNVRIGGTPLAVTVTHNGVDIKGLVGDGIAIDIQGKTVRS